MKAKFFLARLYLVALLTVTLPGLAPDYAIGQSSDDLKENTSGQTEKPEPEKTEEPGSDKTDNSPANNNNEGKASSSRGDSPFGGIASWLIVQMQEGGIIFGTVIAVVSTGCYIVISKLQQRLEVFEKGLHSSEPMENNEKRNSIITVGVGGTGKTTLIKNLFAEEQANPKIATSKYQKYTSVNDNYRYYVADYSGQNILTLIQGLLREQKQPYSPMNFESINSIILIVDVAEAAQPGRLTDQDELKNSWKERVRSHVEQWSETALDAIFGLATSNSLKYVCLFINKADLFPELKQQEIVDEYQQLIDKLAPRCRGIEFDYFVGSAKQGTGIPDLQAALKKSSVSSS